LFAKFSYFFVGKVISSTSVHVPVQLRAQDLLILDSVIVESLTVRAFDIAGMRARGAPARSARGTVERWIACTCGRSPP
jgi:hypothetical protein